MNKNWSFIKSGADGNVSLFCVNIFDYYWIDTKEMAKVKDPMYKKDYIFNVYKVIANGKVYEFAAGEFSACTGVFIFLQKFEKLNNLIEFF